MLTDSILAIVRHALTTFGGAYVANGLITGAQLETLVGSVVAIVGVAWSLVEKRRRAR